MLHEEKRDPPPPTMGSNLMSKEEEDVRSSREEQDLTGGGAAMDVNRPTEGGLAGWTTVFGAFWGLFATFGQLNASGSYQAYYVQHQLSKYTPADVSWIGSIQLWVFFFSGAFVGRLFDAYGPKRLLLAGTVIFTFGMMMTSLCTHFYAFILAQGVLMGLGAGLVFYPSVSATQTHFARLRATATSIAVAGSSLGGIVFPLMLQRLFSEVGFGWSVRISGFVCLVCCLIAFSCCTSRLPPRKPGPLLDLSSFRDVKFMTFTLGSCIATLGLYVPYFYIAQYAEDVLGTSPGRAFDIISVMNAGSVVGRPIPGILADWMGCYNLNVPNMFLAGLLSLTVWLTARSFSALMCYAAFYGVFSGAFIALNPPCVARISRLDQIGMRVGLMFAMLSFPSLVGGPIAGAILSRQHGSYDGLIIFGGVTMMVGGGVIALVKLQLNRNIFAKV